MKNIVWQLFLPCRPRKKQRKILFRQCFAFLSFLLVVLILLLINKQHRQGEDTSSSLPVIIDGHPTTPGSDICNPNQKITSQAYLDMVSTLQTVTPPKLLLLLLPKPCTVQSRAIQWLVDEGNHSSHYEGKELLHRYAIVVLDLALRGGGRQEQGGGVRQPQVPTCSWMGIQCNQLKIPTIESIIWSNQNLTGTIPDEIGLLSSHLNHFDLGENHITGSLPDTLFDCKQLQKLYLHDNALMGTLSSDLFHNLRHLTHLYLGNNQFEGSFPIGLGSQNMDGARPLRK